MKVQRPICKPPEKRPHAVGTGRAGKAGRGAFVRAFCVCLGLCFGAGSTLAQAPLSNLVFTVGTTARDASSNDWSYLVVNASPASLLAGKQFAVYGKAGYPTNGGSFTLRGTMVQQTDTAAINNLLNQSVALGQNLAVLNNALARAAGTNVLGVLHKVPGAAGLTLPQKVLTAFQLANTDPGIAAAVVLLANGNPGLQLCAGRAFAEQIPGTTTYEVREINPVSGTAGDVVGRVTIVPGAPVVLPAPGQPFQVTTNLPSDHLLIRLRWGTPPELRRLSLLQFGFNIWRIPRVPAEAGNFNVIPPTPAQLLGNTNFTRANPTAAVFANKDFTTGSGPGAADDPADHTTYFFADNGRPTLNTNFNAGDQFYYFITPRDLLGRDGLSSAGRLATACWRIPPASPDGVHVDNAVMPGTTNQARLQVVWTQNTNAADSVTEYWVYRWLNPSFAQTNDALPLLNRIGVVPQAPGTNLNYFLDDTAGALTNANLTNVWYTVRAVNTTACDPLLSPHSSPAWGVLRERSAPDATTGEVVGSCGTPVVMFQSFATNIINSDTQTWNFRFTCVRRDRGIAWVLFNITNIMSSISTQLDTIGPVYFPPSEDTAQLDYPITANDNYNHTLNIGCTVGTAYGQMSAAAGCTVTAPVPPNQQHESIFFAGQLLATALSSSDPLLAILNHGSSFCTPAYYVKPDPSGMVSMQFSVASGTPLFIQSLAGNTWTDVGIVTPDSNNVYWVSYPACLVGPVPAFQGCTVNLPSDAGCDQHVARAADNGPVAPLRIRFRLTPRTREYRVYRSADNGPLTLLAEGAAAYDSAFPTKEIETRDEAMPPSPSRLCYFVQTLDEHGNGSPLAFIGCKEVKPATLPKPVLAEPQMAGDTNSPQTLLNWFCPTAGVSRFQFKIARVDPPSPSAPSGIFSLQMKLYTLYNKHSSYLGLQKFKLALSIFSEAHMTTPIGPNFGPGPQFSLTANVLPNVAYDVSVAAVDAQGNIGPSSEVWRFTWTPPVVLENVPWPARPLPPVVDFDALSPDDTPPVFSPRVGAMLFYDSDGVAPNPHYPVGVRIGELDTTGQPNENALTDFSDQYLNYQSGGINSGRSPADPNAGIFRSRGTSRIGQSLLPIVLYRQQETNSLFPRVSGSITQVSPLIERVPWKIDPNGGVTIPDWLFAGEYAYDYASQRYVYFFYLRDLQPVQLGAKYRYFVVRFNDQREAQDIIDAGEVELPLN